MAQSLQPGLDPPVSSHRATRLQELDLVKHKEYDFCDENGNQYTPVVEEAFRRTRSGVYIVREKPQTVNGVGCEVTGEPQTYILKILDVDLAASYPEDYDYILTPDLRQRLKDFHQTVDCENFVKRMTEEVTDEDMTIRHRIDLYHFYYADGDTSEIEHSWETTDLFKHQVAWLLTAIDTVFEKYFTRFIASRAQLPLPKPTRWLARIPKQPRTNPSLHYNAIMMKWVKGETIVDLEHAGRSLNPESHHDRLAETLNLCYQAELDHVDLEECNNTIFATSLNVKCEKVTLVDYAGLRLIYDRASRSTKALQLELKPFLDEQARLYPALKAFSLETLVNRLTIPHTDFRKQKRLHSHLATTLFDRRRSTSALCKSLVHRGQSLDNKEDTQWLWLLFESASQGLRDRPDLLYAYLSLIQAIVRRVAWKWEQKHTGSQLRRRSLEVLGEFDREINPSHDSWRPSEDMMAIFTQFSADPILSQNMTDEKHLTLLYPRLVQLVHESNPLFDGSITFNGTTRPTLEDAVKGFYVHLSAFSSFV